MSEPALVKIEILHYEDEPTRVPYPSLLDVALAECFGLTGIELVSSEEEDTHTLSYLFDGTAYELTYLIHDGRRFPTPNDERLRAAALHLVDWSIADQREAGLMFFEKLSQLGVDASRVWVVTGYAHAARIRLNESSGGKNARIITKPAQHDAVILDMLGVVRKRMGLSED